jgi:hypothetical protein
MWGNGTRFSHLSITTTTTTTTTITLPAAYSTAICKRRNDQLTVITPDNHPLSRNAGHRIVASH